MTSQKYVPLLPPLRLFVLILFTPQPLGPCISCLRIPLNILLPPLSISPLTRLAHSLRFHTVTPLECSVPPPFLSIACFEPFASIMCMNLLVGRS